MSRYRSTDFGRKLISKNGRTEYKNVYKTTQYFKVPETDTDMYFISTEGDRCDLLAHRFYGDSSLWWFIARVNNLKTMSKQTLNPAFAHKGSTYDIWQWKGGVFCHHRWIRVFYLRKRVPTGEIIMVGNKTYKGGQYLPNGPLANFKKTWQAEINKLGFNWKKVRGIEPKYTTAAPIHTPLRGAFPGGRFAPNA